MKASILNKAWFAFDNTYARDLEGYYVPCLPCEVTRPQLVQLNSELARTLKVDSDALMGLDGVRILAGNEIPPGATPIAQAYAGHQFGHFSPQLGDGRALVLGETIDQGGMRRDIAFKGSGPTPFSRRGDGKCALGPALREYLMGEAMDALGIPTTRALAVVATGETVRRERPLPGAILTRVAASHLRVGTFEYFAAHKGPESVRRLADYAIQRHYPELLGNDCRYLAFLEAVADRQATLIARWLGVGFIHGVMNTDNMTISGETIDYGPCAFLETYDPDAVFSSIDVEGRYAYGRQTAIAAWNLARFAETLLPLLDDREERAITLANDMLSRFQQRQTTRWLEVMRDKLCISADSAEETEDCGLITDFLDMLYRRHIDFTQGFRALFDRAAGNARPTCPLEACPEFSAWQQHWRARQPIRTEALLARMRSANPCYIPRNHRVEAALEAAVENGDLTPFRRLLAVLAHPCEGRDEDTAYAEPAPAAFSASYRTFCGT